MKILPRSRRLRLLAALLAAATLLRAQPASVHAAPTLLDTVDLSPGVDVSGSYGFTLNANTHRLYVLGSQGVGFVHSGLKIIDTTTGAVRGGIELATTLVDNNDGSFLPIAASADDSAAPAGNKIYVLGRRNIYRDSRLFLRFVDGATETNITDPSSDLLLDRSTSPSSIFANPVVVNPVTHKVYVTDGNAQVYVVDGPSRQLLKQISVPGDTETLPVVNRTLNKLYFFSAGIGGGAIVDGASDAVTALGVPFVNTQGAAVNEAGNRVYVVARSLQDNAFTLFALDAGSGSVVASTTTGINPVSSSAARSMAFDAATNTLFVADPVGPSNDNPKITAFDATTLAVKTAFPHAGFRVAFDAGRLFLIGYSTEIQSAVGVLDPATGAFAKTTVGYQPGYLAVNRQTGRAFVLDTATNEVTAIDTNSRTVVGRFPIRTAQPGGAALAGDTRTIGVSAALNRFYVTHTGYQNIPGGFGSSNAAFLDVHDGNDGRLLQTVSLGADSFASNGRIAVDDTHRRVYVTGGTTANNSQTGVVFVLDADANTLVATITSPRPGALGGLAVNPVTRRVYATGGAGSNSAVIIMDGATNTVVTTVPSTSLFPGRIAVNTKTNKVFVATTDGDLHSIQIIDGAKDAAAGGFSDGSLNPFSNAYDVAVDEDSNTVFVLDDSVSSRDRTGGVLAFDAGNGYRQIGQVELGYLPFSLAFDPGTHRLFVSNNYDGTVSVVQPDSLGGASHPPFFTGEVPLSNGVYYLAFPASGTFFGYYSYLSDPRFIFHFDLGYEYWFDNNANDGRAGIFFYDFKSGGFFYTSPTFPFPYLYDFSLNAVLYYFPDPQNPGRYNTNGVRYFYNYATGQIISK